MRFFFLLRDRNGGRDEVPAVSVAVLIESSGGGLTALTRCSGGGGDGCDVIEAGSGIALESDIVFR